MSGKGGVGKTTSAINLGLAMNNLGSEVLVLDGNLSSPNLSVHLGNTYFPVTIHDVMQNTHKINQAIYKHHSGLRIIPADMSMESMRLVNFQELEKKLQDIHLLAEYLLIDGSPGLGRESTSLMNLSDEILIVTNPDTPAVLDAKRLIDFARKLDKTITGLIITKYSQKRYRMSVDEIEKFLDLPALAIIPEDKRFEKSVHRKTPFIHLHPRARASKAYYKLAEIITGRTKE